MYLGSYLKIHLLREAGGWRFPSAPDLGLCLLGSQYRCPKPEPWKWAGDIQQEGAEGHCIGNVKQETPMC